MQSAHKEVCATPWRLGWGFAKGKLSAFRDKDIVVLRGWPEPLAWRKTKTQPWRHTRVEADEILRDVLYWLGYLNHSNLDESEPAPEMIAGFPKGEIPPNLYLRAKVYPRIRKIARDFIAGTPLEIIEEVARYRNRYWSLYCALVRCPGALDLSRGNPGLFFALANNWVFHKPAVKQPMRAIRSLVRKKQKVILDWLGFPATETCRRILAKLDLQTLSVESLLYLRSALKNPELVKTFSHAPRINSEAIRLATNRRYGRFVTPRLLYDIAEGRHTHHKPFFMLADTIRMAAYSGWNGCPGKFASWDRLLEVHDELSRNLKASDIAPYGFRTARFPPPPFIGTAAIQPITSVVELFAEGREMRHCIGIHAPEVVARMEYVYKVLSPVRATLVIRAKGKLPRWEIAGAGNAPIDASVATAVLAELYASPPNVRAPAQTQPPSPQPQEQTS